MLTTPTLMKPKGAPKVSIWIPEDFWERSKVCMRIIGECHCPDCRFIPTRRPLSASGPKKYYSYLGRIFKEVYRFYLRTEGKLYANAFRNLWEHKIGKMNLGHKRGPEIYGGDYSFWNIRREKKLVKFLKKNYGSILEHERNFNPKSFHKLPVGCQIDYILRGTK